MNKHPKDNQKDWAPFEDSREMLSLCDCGWHYKEGECPFKEKIKPKKYEPKTKG